MAMDRQGAQRPGPDVSHTETSQEPPHKLSWVPCDRTKGLEGALRATETSCVPLLENQALTILS